MEKPVRVYSAHRTIFPPNISYKARMWFPIVKIMQTSIEHFATYSKMNESMYAREYSSIVRIR